MVQKYSGIIETVSCYIVENQLNWALALGGKQEGIFAVGRSVQVQPPGKPWANQGLTHPGLCSCAGQVSPPPRGKHGPAPGGVACGKATHKQNICVCDAKICPELLGAAGSLQGASPGRGFSGLGWKQQGPNVKGASGWVGKGRQSCKVLQHRQK